MVLSFKQKTAYEMRISDWSSDVCSSDLASFIAHAAAVGIEAGGHRRHLRRIERLFRRRCPAEQPSGIGDHILRRRRLVIGDIVDRAGIGPGDRGFQHGCDILDMDAAENLARLDDALRRAAADGVELTTAGTIDARQPEDMHRQVAIAPEREPGGFGFGAAPAAVRSEEHTSELQSLMRISYAVFCLKKKTHKLYQTSMKD